MSNGTDGDKYLSDFVNATRGHLGSLVPGVVHLEDSGQEILNNDAYRFLVDSPRPPDKANSSLWRQGQLCYQQGLFEVVPGIYQVRGLDIDNVSFVETTNGKLIVIDPTTCYETGKAALDLYEKHRPPRPIVAMIFSHCHGDHFGGGEAVTEKNPDVEIYAPDGFWEHAVSEWVYTGTAMLRRAVYMYGECLEKKADGHIGCGLGMLPATGRSDLPRPTFTINEYPLQEVDIDGSKVIFQLTPNTEAPAEMNFYFPQYEALCMAENACHTLHNIQTLRGATVRDARQWSRYLNEALTHFGHRTNVVFASHHWPTWEPDNIRSLLTKQRDMYAYLHDQTLRMLNQGFTGLEIAEKIKLPLSLAASSHLRGYYGSVSHNVKGIYNRYMGWYDGNPAHLWEHTPVKAARRYVDCMGGPSAVVEKAKEYIKRKDLRFAATLLNHAVFANADDEVAKEELACVYEKLGYGAENATWRNIYLVGAKELREGIHAAVHEVSHDSAARLDVDQLLDTMSIRIDGWRAQNDPMAIEFHLTDEEGGTWLMTLSNGALTHCKLPATESAVDPTTTQPEAKAPTTVTDSSSTEEPDKLTLSLTHLQLVDLVLSKKKDLDDISVNGNAALFWRLMGYLATPDPGFAIVTPDQANEE